MKLPFLSSINNMHRVKLTQSHGGLRSLRLVVCVCTVSICLADISVLWASPQVVKVPSPDENSSAVVETQRDADSVPPDEVEQGNQASEEQQFIEAILESTPAPSESVALNGEEEGLRFAFDRTPWRDVIRWIADEADLALHVGEVPTGSFSYADPSLFTVEGAIDRINLFLQPEGYAILRSGRMLSVVNLGDPRSKQQLDALARMVEPEDLANLPDHDVVRCLFPLGEIDAQGAVTELEVLNLLV
ncbi:MAG: hypothetical protein VXZ38_07350, partial [Planctomycetota bacterium]|nr:hypothetical protein [Planctomycetota bacterium]